VLIFALLSSVVNDGFQHALDVMKAHRIDQAEIAVDYTIDKYCQPQVVNVVASSENLELSNHYVQAQLQGMIYVDRATYIDGHLNVLPAKAHIFPLLSLKCKKLDNGRIVDLEQGLSRARLVDGEVIDSKQYREVFVLDGGS